LHIFSRTNIQYLLLLIDFNLNEKIYEFLFLFNDIIKLLVEIIIIWQTLPAFLLTTHQFLFKIWLLIIIFNSNFIAIIRFFLKTHEINLNTIKINKLNIIAWITLKTRKFDLKLSIELAHGSTTSSKRHNELVSNEEVLLVNYLENSIC